METWTDGARLVLSGEFDVRSTFAVRTALHDLLESCSGDVVVDLAGVTAIDQTALRMLAAATHLLEREDRHLLLSGCTPATLRMLHLTRLIRLCELERPA